jgi:predicted nucleic acid-binding Zn ribbon protein
MTGCRECGNDFKPSGRAALHCSERCRLAFNRRRRDRGAELYDFVMSGHPDTVEKLVGSYRTADKALRGGRPSFQPTTQALVRLPASYGPQGDNR